MYLENLHLSAVRNLADINLNCSPGINVITGKNAAGKTAILEGIHMLAKASSFRTPRARDIIQHGQDSLTVTARIRRADHSIVTTGIEKGKQQTLIKFNGEKVKKRSEQAKNLPLFTITAESQRLIYGTPRERRHWLDWSLFHVEHDYMRVWQDYHHALRQRNCLIRARATAKQYVPWEQQLAETGLKLRSMRQAYLQNLASRLRGVGDETLRGLEINLESGEENRDEILQKYRDRESDISAGHTQNGPHREEIRFHREGKNLGKVLSRGEGKRFVVILSLAQAQLYRDFSQLTPLLLVDDLPAELDEEQRDFLLALIEQQPLQAFLTTVQPGLIPVKHSLKRVFHVEQGQLMKVIE